MGHKPSSNSKASINFSTLTKNLPTTGTQPQYLPPRNQSAPNRIDSVQTAPLSTPTALEYCATIHFASPHVTNLRCNPSRLPADPLICSYPPYRYTPCCTLYLGLTHPALCGTSDLDCGCYIAGGCRRSISRLS